MMRKNLQSQEAQRELEIVGAVVKGGGHARPEDAELVELALSIRELRPVLDHGAATRLDERLTSAPPKRRSSALKPALAGLAVCLMLAAVVATQWERINAVEPVTKLSDSGGEDKMLGSTAQSAPETNSAQAARGDLKALQQESLGANADIARVPSPRAATMDRVQAQDATISLATPPDDFEDTADQVGQVADRAGGYVQSTSVRVSGSGNGRGAFLLMIPADRLQDTVSDLARLGHVRSRSLGAEDITANFNAAERTLTARRARVRSLERELAAAANENERAVIERRLALARAAEKRATQGVRVMRTRANYVPVNVKLVADKKAAEADKGAIAKALDRAGEILQAMLAVAIVALALVLPVALAIAIAMWLVRGIQRRRAERAIDAAASQPEKR